MGAKLPNTLRSEPEKRRSRLFPVAGFATTGLAVGGAAVFAARRSNSMKHASAQSELPMHVSDMMALNAFVLGEIDSHLEDQAMRMHHEERALEEELRRKLMLHNEGLQRELESLGGRAPSKMKSAAGAFAGMAMSMGERMLYRGMQGHPVSRMMRDSYTMLSAIAVSYSMLDATARALHRDSLAEVAARQHREVAELVIKFSEHIPRIVVDELAEGSDDVDRSTADRAVEATKQAWAQAAGQ